MEEQGEDGRAWGGGRKSAGRTEERGEREREWNSVPHLCLAVGLEPREAADLRLARVQDPGADVVLRVRVDAVQDPEAEAEQLRLALVRGHGALRLEDLLRLLRRSATRMLVSADTRKTLKICQLSCTGLQDRKRHVQTDLCHKRRVCVRECATRH